jgi:arylsulfatase A-like enzyme
VPPAAARWLPRVAVALFVMAASLLAWREGGGADARHPPPEPGPGAGAAAPPAAGHGAPAFEVKRRLTDALADASFDVPSLSASQPFMQPYWRKMRAPWTHLEGPAASMALTLALRTSRDTEKQLSVAVPGGDSWVPQARVWNMNEGSFDERESIFAPTPATLAFRVDVPPAARLRLSPAVLTGVPVTTVFEVSVVDASGSEQTLSSTRIAGTDARAWVDVDADLARWGGQRVELRLKTSADSPAPDEKKWAPTRLADDAEGDAGAAERMPVPPMSLALWGDPVLVAQEPARTPCNVLWIVVDALRPDVAASLHDAAEDAAKRAAPRPPLDALLPAIPGLMPSLDALAARGVRFTHAWSAATWTRAGTLAMLAGERSSEAGIDTTGWILQPAAIARYYASPPPLLPLLVRRVGADTAAFVNNFFMAGYVPVGVDMGFERVTDHRYRTRDMGAITRDSIAWMRAHARDRFFLFVNYDSPHEPYDPPKDMLARVPPAPAGPSDRQVRAYMAEGAKDDAAIGELLGELDALALTGSTLVIVTADHGETLSAAHDGDGLEGIKQRFHHAVGNFEETTRVPLVMALPGVLEGGKAVTDRVRSTDIAPTVLEVLGLEPDPRMSGRSLLPLARGIHEADARVVVSEGRQSRAILWDHFRLVTHDGGDPPVLFDLDVDPGERHDVARVHPDVVAELQARLAAALANTPAADAKDPGGTFAAPTVHLRFVTAGRARRVSGELRVGDDRHGATFTFEPVGIPREALHADGPTLTFAMSTSPDALVGLDLRTDPPGASVAWRLYLDDAPWPPRATFAGPFGLPAVAAQAGIAGDEARAEVYAAALPVIDPARDLGLFVTRDRPGDRAGSTDASGGGEGAAAAAAAREMQQVLQQWGYAHGSH